MTDPTDVASRLAESRHAHGRLREALDRVIIGQSDVIDQVLWALIAGGHVLLEGAPGLGKTLLVRTLASTLDLAFSRIQFTPDLMPSDVTGTNVLTLDAAGHPTGGFELHRGPIFGQLVLADEINRATPKTQSALLEAMQEHAVTIAGQRHALDEPFMVLATQNPIEMEGTYPLPEAQLDRFLVKVVVRSPSEGEMTEILQRTTAQRTDPLSQVLSRDDVNRWRSLCREIAIAEPVARYAARLVAASSPESDGTPQIVRRAVRYGAGVRGGQSLVLAAKAVALLDGRPHVALDDVRAVALPALRHRIISSFEGEADGVTTDQVVQALLDSVPSRPASVDAAARGS